MPDSAILAPTYIGKDIFNTRNFELSTSRYLLDSPVVPHSHDYLEIAFVVGGNGVHLSAAEEKRTRIGDGWLLFPGAWHSYLEPSSLDICNCCFAESLLKRELIALSHLPAASKLLWQQDIITVRRTPLHFQVKTEMFDSFLALWKNVDSATTAPRQIAALLLFLEVVVGYLTVEEKLSVAIHPAVLKVTKLLEADIQRRWRLEEMADSVGLAPNYFHRVFKQQMGLAPIAYLTRLRAESAARLLLQTGLSIAEIGRSVGWDDPNYFARRFRDVYGQSASEYRSRARRPA
jgi:AraC family L-rhamnose operon transcriptional activator RhaR